MTASPVPVGAPLVPPGRTNPADASLPSSREQRGMADSTPLTGTVHPLSEQPPLPMDRVIRADAPDAEAVPMDVLFVGGGPAGLAGAIELAKLVQQDNEAGGGLGDVEIAVLEKAAGLGEHSLRRGAESRSLPGTLPRRAPGGDALPPPRHRRGGLPPPGEGRHPPPHPPHHEEPRELGGLPLRGGAVDGGEGRGGGGERLPRLPRGVPPGGGVPGDGGPDHPGWPEPGRRTRAPPTSRPWISPPRSRSSPRGPGAS
jgi:hypothetical protein